MGPRGGRAREKGGVSRLNVTENEYANSNSTTAKFLGGPRKSWMTWQSGITDGSRDSNQPQRTEHHRERLCNQAAPSTVAVVHSNVNVGSHQHFETSQASPTRYVSPLRYVGSSMQKDPAGDGTSVEAVLPSPAPTDENGESNSAARRRRSWSSDSGGRIRVTDRPEDSIYGADTTGTPPSLSTTGLIDVRPHAAASDFGAVDRVLTDGQPKKRRKPSTPRPSPGEVPEEPLNDQQDTVHSPARTSLAPLCHAPSDEQMGNFINAIIVREKLAADHIGTRGDTEVPRLSLLRQACVQRDHVYLLVHQLYCVDTKLPSNVQRLERIGLSRLHLRGLGMLLPLLLPNADRLAEEAISWFAGFPFPFERMLQEYQIYRDALESATVCLANLAHKWISYRESCNKRDYPPLVDELVDVLGMESSVLQSVVSRAIFKDTWHDACLVEGEKIFQQNQLMVQRRPTRLSVSDKDRANQDLKARYRRLRTLHNHHSQPRLQYTALPTSSHNTPTPFTSSRGRRQASGARNIPRVSLSHDQIRRSPTLNNNVPNTTAAQTPSVVPSQPSLHEWQSPMTPQDFHFSPLASPNGALPVVNAQAMDVRWPGIGSSPPMVPPHLQNLVQYQRSLPEPRYPERLPAGSPLNPNLAQTLPTAHLNGYPAGFQLVNGSNRANFVPAGPVSTFIGNAPRQMPGANGLRQPVDYQPLIPPRGRTLLHQSQARPDVTAIHQLSAMSPVLKAADFWDEQNSAPKRFRCLKSVTIIPHRLMVGFRQHLSWSFDLGEGDMRLLSSNFQGQHGFPPTRVVHVGSEFRRVRCIDATKLGDHITESNWVTAPQSWPPNVAVILNNKSFDIRKKIHHGKDLPVEITASLQTGSNTLSVSIIGTQNGNKTSYAIGIETIELIYTDGAKNSIGTLTFEQGRQRIISRLGNHDSEIEVVDTSVLISLTDPYTSLIWDTPIRGRHCRHDQCFDLDTFLSTRNGKPPSQPCDPDAFKCPICGGDARPQMLVKDEFFVALRRTLGEMGRLDAKAIVMQLDGTWEIQEEEKTGETGDGGSGRRGCSRGGEETPGCDGVSRSEIIEID
ncbi:MAG: hypothetical protein Q9222_003318 [Ikaeria aurantiellina]